MFAAMAEQSGWKGMKTGVWVLMLHAGLMTGAAAPVFGAVADAGTNSPFDLGAGARALALAGAYVAVADDATAIFWNPGGLAQLDQAEVSAMHINLFFDTPYDYLGMAYPIMDWGTFALGAVRISTDGVILRDERSRLLGSGRGSLDLREYLFAYSRDVLWNIRAGAVVKVDQQRLIGDFDTGVGMDLGLQYHFPKDMQGISGFDWENLRLGLTFQNLMGSQLRLNRVTDVLPLNIKCGVAYTYHTRDSMRQKIMISSAWEKSTWRASQLSVGLEYSLWEMLAVRGGINSNAWTAGGGVQYYGFAFDYALAGEELGLTHRFSMSYRFGSPLSRQRAAQEQQRQAEMDREAEARAKKAVEKTRQEMEKAIKDAEKRHRSEKTALLAQREQLLDAERQQRRAAVADEYFKSYHYFQGMKDYMSKNYKQALVEFETVAKYDPNYLELPMYLQRTRQLIKGKIEFMSQDNYDLYYQGIDQYLADDFMAAIQTWEAILKTEPNNLLVLRNIDEARERIVKLRAVREQIEAEEKEKKNTPEDRGVPPAPK